jgi:hypothetical protein
MRFCGVPLERKVERSRYRGEISPTHQIPQHNFVSPSMDFQSLYHKETTLTALHHPAYLELSCAHVAAI